MWPSLVTQLLAVPVRPVQLMRFRYCMPAGRTSVPILPVKGEGRRRYVRMGKERECGLHTNRRSDREASSFTETISELYDLHT